ncbi:NrfD/PsrC family molybdoenzyme membrane anchor subunit [Haliangium ochraceum]|uniref:Polysulphide reductase NrfD n=1 Tax=Haliangium ochraceum (strain DSM 14365 / JCM 11303 / SMP-2) TaxID=502025 RepID=D0LJA4_HALO1|nr:NrfD/PsrC family molybdoenzyme membrane anchor subunit [Haliangium ochraceum]ACY14951.1 Polysulphide reductase NrfD [Haliangium ochraceum DSM 14365]
MSTEAEAKTRDPGAAFREITNSVCAVHERPKPPRAWYIALAIALGMLGIFGMSIVYLFANGIGIYGNNNTIGWAWPIVNFVFWVGIGHAGTLISAILYLLRQGWRTSINRSAEAMTIFAVACAGIFPIIHTGRPWFAYFMLPIPNDMDIWQQFRSPLMWDVFAISTYATTSILFWFMGMVPDLATFRDRAKSTIARVAYGILAMGWRGSARQWHRYERAYLILAALATPLVLSVHSVVSFDFATSQTPGWHTTILPPYFVAGAIFSGFAMVLTLMVPARELFGLKHIIKASHIEAMCKVTLATGTMVGFAYGVELFIAWYSGVMYEQFAFYNRAFGPFAWSYWTMVFCNVAVPQAFWFKKARQNPWIIVGLCLLVNVGMWFERFVIVVTSLSRTMLPSSWHYYMPTLWDAATLIGSFGLFMTLFLLFCRYLPIVAMAEVKSTLPEAHAGHH